MKKSIVFLFGLTVITVILAVLQITVSTIFSTSGIDLGNMQNQIQNLQTENMMLREQIYTSSSYTHLASNAASLGFVQNANQIVLGSSNPLAIRQ